MPAIDFLVIGAPNSRAEALDRLLRGHSQLALPRSAAAPVLVDEHRYVFGPEWSAPGFFDREGAAVRRGIVSPEHMGGLISSSGAVWPPEEVAAAMVRTMPDLKLIALLEEPVTRAIAHHRVAVARGLERRPLVRALHEQSSPGAVAAARLHPRETNGYITCGEYGRMLEAYRQHYARSQLLVLLRSELDGDPAGALARIASFLEVDDAWSTDADGPTTHSTGIHAKLPPELRSRLQRHFAADARRLEDSIEIEVPWAQVELPDSPKARSKRRPAAPEVSIVMLVHETPEEAQAALDSIARHTDEPHEVLLVDNGSSPPVRDALAAMAETHDARLVRFDSNLTFTVANNTAIGETRSEEILLLNSDVVVTPNWLSNLRIALHSAPDVALVGPRTNNVSPPQGGIWLDDSSPAGVERFGRFFNHSDPTRWFEASHLCGFAMLARRSAWEAAGGFNEDYGWYGEDGELCGVLARSGWRLVCAGDTFIYHAGHRSFWLGDVNRTAARFGVDGAQAPEPADSTPLLVRGSNGWVFEVRDGVASHLETHAVVAMLAAGNPIAKMPDVELAKLSVGPPISPCRVRGTDEVWVLHSGTRRRVTGDKQRIRRLPELAMVEASELERLPRGSDLAVEDGLRPVPQIKSRLPFTGVAIAPDRLALAERVAEEIGIALERGRGFALIRLDLAETLLLNEGTWPTDEEELDLPRVGVRGDPEAAATAVRRAIVDADAVGVLASHERFVEAPLLEQLLLHFDLYPRLRCSAQINYELLGVDPATGRVAARPRLASLLSGRPLALVGPSRMVGRANRQVRDRLRRAGLEVRLQAVLDEMDDVEDAFSELAELRDAYDAVLVIGDVPVKPLCARLARELDVVALDLGHALHGTPHWVSSSRPFHLKASEDVAEYMRQSALPAPDPPHEFEGRLVRVPGDAAVFYIERGRARPLVHRALLELFDEPPAPIEREALDTLPSGVPLFAVHERFTGTYILIDGTKRPVLIGLPLSVLDHEALEAFGIDNRPVHWYPGAGPGLAGRGDR